MNLKGKKLLVQGAGRGHLGLMKTAKRMGIYTVVTGLPGNYPCTSLADKVCIADISNKEQILRVAKDENVDGILICCSDTGLRSVGYVCDKLNLHGISEHAAAISSNKYLMKEALKQQNVSTAKYMLLRSKDDLVEVSNSMAYPLIVKAVDLQGSKGIFIVQDEGQLKDAYDKVMLLTKQSFCIVEEFIEGEEFGAQAFVYQGNVLFVLPHGDQLFKASTAIPIGHYMPLNLSTELLDKIQIEVVNAIKAIGLDNCAVNVDLILKDNQVYIIELTGRVGANCLPELVSYYLGIDYYEMIITMALGGNPSAIYNNRKLKPSAVLSKMLYSTESGILRDIQIPCIRSSNVDFDFFVKKGDCIRKISNSNDIIGQFIVHDKDLDTCENIYCRFRENLKITIG